MGIKLENSFRLSKFEGLVKYYLKVTVFQMIPELKSNVIIVRPLSVYADLWKTGMFERMTLQTDEDEHSIEMHLPYTAKAMER